MKCPFDGGLSPLTTINLMTMNGDRTPVPSRVASLQDRVGHMDCRGVRNSIARDLGISWIRMDVLPYGKILRKAIFFQVPYIESEYERCVRTLDRTGVLGPLQDTESVGVIGIDGREYPVPTQEQLQGLFARNKDLVDRKLAQGFTQLQLTPMAMAIPQLVDRVSDAVRRHAEAGGIIATKMDPAEADVPIRANTDEPVWIWDRVRQALDTPDLVYFPRAYTERDHKGLTKEEVMQELSLCAMPGWSVGLIEPIPIMPRQGMGKVMGGRKQLEAYSTPHDYLETLGTSDYEGETGWTLEDFLTHFMIQLETTGQVSHDRSDGNAMWLLGSYMPTVMPKALIVPTGTWARDAGRRMFLGAHRTGNRLRDWVARSTVRLEG